MTPAVAQEPLDRSKPPLAGPPKDIRFPDYFEKVLDNGLKLIVYQQSDLPAVTVSLIVRGGSMHDRHLPGLAGMTAELLTKGTATRSATEIAEEVDFLGGSLTAGSGWDNTSVSLNVLSKHLDRGVELMADVVVHPTFPAAELDRAREQRLASILQRKASAPALASLQFNRAVFGTHPYGQPAEGTEASVKSLVRDDLARFHEQFYLPNNSFVVAVGDVTPDRMEELATRLFGAWKGGALPETNFPPIESVQERKIQVVERPGAVQSSILVGHVGVARNNPDYIPLTVMNTLLGGYFGSRLNLNLREDKGYTYGARSGFDARLFPGPFSAGAEVRNEVTDSSVAEILNEIRRIHDQRVPLEELEGVKGYLMGLFPIQIETPTQVAARIVSIELYGLGKSYYNSYNTRINHVSVEDISRVAGQYLSPDRIVIVAAGKSELLKNTLAPFGTVEVFSAEGEKMR